MIEEQALKIGIEKLTLFQNRWFEFLFYLLIILFVIFILYMIFL